MEVVVASEVEPAVHDVEEEFGGEVVAILFGIALGGVHRNADFSGYAVDRIAFEGDDIGRRWIGEEVGVELGERVIVEKDQGEFAGRNAAEKFHGVQVEGGDDAFELGTGKA